jgi:hypothetical protein
MKAGSLILDPLSDVVQYLADTNDKPKFSLQVKEVFTLQEKPAFATETHGAEGFEQKFKGALRLAARRALSDGALMHRGGETLSPS